MVLAGRAFELVCSIFELISSMLEHLMFLLVFSTQMCALDSQIVVSESALCRNSRAESVHIESPMEAKKGVLLWECKTYRYIDIGYQKEMSSTFVCVLKMIEDNRRVPF